MEFQVKFTFKSNVPDEVRSVTATDWQNCYIQAQAIITAEGWTDAVIKTINRLANDIMTRKEKINKALLQFPPYQSLGNQDKLDIVNFIDGKLP